MVCLPDAYMQQSGSCSLGEGLGTEMNWLIPSCSEHLTGDNWSVYGCYTECNSTQSSRTPLPGLSEGTCSGRAWFRAHQTQISTGWVLDQLLPPTCLEEDFPCQCTWETQLSTVSCSVHFKCIAFFSSKIYPLTCTDSLSCLLMTFLHSLCLPRKAITP